MSKFQYNHQLQKYPELRANAKTISLQRHGELIPTMSSCWFPLLYSIVRLPESRGTGRALLIEVFVKPEAQDTTS